MEMHSGGVGDAFSLVVVIHSFLLGLKWMIDYLVVFSLNRICTMGVALMALGVLLGLAWSPVTPVTPRHFAWQAWHNLTSTFVLRGRRVTIEHPRSFRVAGVALMALGGVLGLAWSPVTPVTPRHFAWQAWHKLTSTVVLRGRRGTTSHPPSFCVAGVALMALGGALGLAWSPVTPVTPRHFAWQAWHNLTSTVVLRGRRGTTSQLLCHNRTSTIVSRGRRGTHGTGWRAWTGLVARDARDAATLCVAGVAQPHIHLRFAWQAWQNSRPPSFCVAGVAQTHIYRRFAWQAWHSWHWVARLDWLGRPWRRGTLRGRRGTTWHPPSFHAAGVAQTHIYLRFTWQAWHLWHWASEIGHLHAKMRSLLVVERQGSTALQQRCAAQTWQILFLACRLSSCCSCRSVSVLVQLEVADNSSSTHTTTTQLQLVSQGKDAVIGSSLVAQFHKSSVKFLRTTSLACIRLNHNYNVKHIWPRS